NAGHAQVKHELGRPSSGVARQIACLADCRQNELIQYRGIDWLAGHAPFQAFDSTVKTRAVVADVVQVSIHAQSNIKWSSGSQTQDGSNAEVAQERSCFQRA